MRVLVWVQNMQVLVWVQKILSRSLAIILLMGSLSLQANTQVSGWYQVEIILFARINPLATGEGNPSTPSYPSTMIRIGPSRDALIQPEKLTQLAEIIGFESRETLPDTLTGHKETPAGEEQAPLSANQPDAFRLLLKQDKFLNDVAGGIGRSRDYRLLLHDAWRQPLGTVDKAIPVLIQAGKHYDDQFEIDGYIIISKSRYLHVDTHLWFNEFALRDTLSSQISNAAPQAPADVWLEASKKLKTWKASRHTHEIIRTHKMQQSRKMRSNSLHYIDHPYFGVLISINRYSPAPAADKP